jgi:hypothetical protein
MKGWLDDGHSNHGHKPTGHFKWLQIFAFSFIVQISTLSTLGWKHTKMSCVYWVSLDPNRLSSKLLLMNVVLEPPSIFPSRQAKQPMNGLLTRTARSSLPKARSRTHNGTGGQSPVHIWPGRKRPTSQAPLSSIATQAAPPRRSEHGGQNGAPACRVGLGRSPRPASTLTTEGES